MLRVQKVMLHNVFVVYAVSDVEYVAGSFRELFCGRGYDRAVLLKWIGRWPMTSIVQLAAENASVRMSGFVGSNCYPIRVLPIRVL